MGSTARSTFFGRFAAVSISRREGKEILPSHPNIMDKRDRCADCHAAVRTILTTKIPSIGSSWPVQSRTAPLLLS